MSLGGTSPGGGLRARLRWPLVADLSALVVVLLALANAGGPVAGPVRVLVALWFLVVCPGVALAPTLAIREPWTELLVGVLLSLGFDVLAATGLAAAGAFTLHNVLLVLCAVCVAGTLATALVPHRRSSAGGEPA